MTKVFLLAGQSNMVGAGVSAELLGSFMVRPPYIRLFEEDAWRPLTWRKRFGPEVGFAHALATACPTEEFVLCKVACSGANLYYDWNPDGVSRGTEDAYRGPMFPRLRAAVQQVTRLLSIAGDSSTFAGMLWMQGERDSVFEHMARAYADNLTAFIAAVRELVQQPELPFLIAQIAPRKYDRETRSFVHAYRAIVQDAQISVAAADPYAALVPTLDLPQSDNLHFDTDGQLVLGQRYAEAYCGMRKAGTAPYRASRTIQA